MAGGVSLGAIFARLGIDTEQFQGGLSKAENRLSGFATQAEAAGQKASAGFDKVQRGAMMGLQGINALAAGGIPSIQAMVGVFGELGLAGMALATTYRLGNEAVTKHVGHLIAAGPPAKELADAMMADEEAFRRAADQLERGAKALGLAGPEWKFATEWTRENAEQIVFLTGELRKEQAARAESRRVLIEKNEAQRRAIEANRTALSLEMQMANALVRGRAEAQAYGDEVRRTYGIITKQEAAAQLEDLAKKMQAARDSGADVAQIAEKMGPAFASAFEDAKKLGVDVTGQFEQLAGAIERGDTSMLTRLLPTIGRIPEETSRATETSKQYLDKMGDDLAGSLSGGFGRGIQEGTNAGRQALDEFMRETEGRRWQIRLEIDPADLQRQIQDAVSGLTPRTGGGV